MHIYYLTGTAADQSLHTSHTEHPTDTVYWQTFQHLAPYEYYNSQIEDAKQDNMIPSAPRRMQGPNIQLLNNE